MLSNPDPNVTPEMLYLIGQDYKWFGSSLPNYSPEKIAAVHDACGLVIPNVYQGDMTDSEAGDLLYAREIGADGAQVNNPDVVAEALEEPVPTAIEVNDDALEVCLVNAINGMGLPLKQIHVQGTTVETRTRRLCRATRHVRSRTAPFHGRRLGPGERPRLHAGSLVRSVRPAPPSTYRSKEREHRGEEHHRLFGCAPQVELVQDQCNSEAGEQTAEEPRDRPAAHPEARRRARRHRREE